MIVQELTAFGATAPFVPREVPLPEPGPGEVRVQVVASSINPADYKARELGHMLDFVPQLPARLGMDMAGVVDGVGAGVTAWKVGDPVFGTVAGVLNLPGTLAEYVIADARLLAPKPGKLDFRAAAALPLPAITAWEGIVTRGQVKPGQRVLVFGASGNVGSIAIQLAKRLGAYVVGIDVAQRLHLVKEIGADALVSVDTPVADVVSQHTAGQGFDLVFDTIGGEHLADAFAAARLEGTVTSTIGLANVDLSPMHIKALQLQIIYMLTPMMHNVGRERHGEWLRTVVDLVDRTGLTPLVDARRFKLTDATAAYDYAASGQTQGKVVIDIAEEGR